MPSVEVRKRINLYLTWTSVSALELGLRRETAAFNLPPSLLVTKPFQMPNTIFKQNSGILLSSLTQETVWKTHKLVWVAKQTR